jgi:hypothetical protein
MNRIIDVTHTIECVYHRKWLYLLTDKIDFKIHNFISFFVCDLLEMKRFSVRNGRIVHLFLKKKVSDE